MDRLLLQIKDEPFDLPILARFASDGTLKMLQYLVLLHDSYTTAIHRFGGAGKTFLHHQLLPELAEECRSASEKHPAISHHPLTLLPGCAQQR